MAPAHSLRFVFPWLAFATLATAQVPDAKSFVQCAAVLPVPQYSIVARLARLVGSVSVQALVRDGVATDVNIAGDIHPALRVLVEQSVGATRFLSQCNNLQLAVRFTFEMRGMARFEHDPGSVTFKAPNEFIIVTRPPEPQP
jgi:hypothetical protein